MVDDGGAVSFAGRVHGRDTVHSRLHEARVAAQGVQVLADPAHTKAERGADRVIEQSDQAAAGSGSAGSTGRDTRTA